MERPIFLPLKVSNEVEKKRKGSLVLLIPTMVTPMSISGPWKQM